MIRSQQLKLLIAEVFSLRTFDFMDNLNDHAMYYYNITYLTLADLRAYKPSIHLTYFFQISSFLSYHVSISDELKRYVYFEVMYLPNYNTIPMLLFYFLVFLKDWSYLAMHFVYHYFYDTYSCLSKSIMIFTK